MMKRFCYTLDLKDNNASKKNYIKHHQNVWPEIIKSLKNSGILKAEIYNVDTRLFLIFETIESYDEEYKKQLDDNNPLVQKWEKLMSKYQKKLPFSKNNEKWVKMNKIFEL